MIKVCIMDYGSGNVKSIANLVSYLGYRVIVSNEISEIESATHLILPGVGSFATAMRNINSQISISEIEVEVIQKKKPFFLIFCSLRQFIYC